MAHPDTTDTTSEVHGYRARVAEHGRFRAVSESFACPPEAPAQAGCQLTVVLRLARTGPKPRTNGPTCGHAYARSKGDVLTGENMRQLGGPA